MQGQDQGLEAEAVKVSGIPGAPPLSLASLHVSALDFSGQTRSFEGFQIQTESEIPQSPFRIPGEGLLIGPAWVPVPVLIQSAMAKGAESQGCRPFAPAPMYGLSRPCKCCAEITEMLNYCLNCE